MAEFVASLITLVGAGITTAAMIEKVVRGLRHAPEELLALANEVSITNQVIERARFVLKEHRTTSTAQKKMIEDHPVNFGHVVGRASGIFVQIQGGMESISEAKIQGIRKHASRVLWLKRKEQLLRLQLALRECRQEMVSFIGVETLYTASQMAVQINDLHAMLTAETPTRALSTPGSKEAGSQLMLTTKGPAPPKDFLSFTTSYSPDTPSCEFPCGCACHRQIFSRVDTRLLGSLFLGSRWIPFATSTCTEKRCRGGSTSDVRFTYYFPSWYVRKAVTFLYSENGPQFSVRFANIVPENHDLFGCAKTGDVRKLKLLLDSRQASPTDIDHDGDGLLICTLELKEFSLEMCNFVFNLPGVDPLALNRYGQSFVSLAWQLILSMDPDTRHKDPLASWLISVITKYDYFEERQFKTLHKIVTECSTIPLLSQLQTSTREIDDPDASGWTPLMWATFRHNAEAIQQLLDYDADANLLNNEGQHALHLGAWSWNPVKKDVAVEVAAWECLVSRVTDVDLIDRYNWTALMYAAGTARSVPLLKALVKAGANVNLSGHAGITPLHWAAQVNRADAVQYLLEVGAELSAVTLEGKTPLHFAVSENAHESLQALFETGATGLYLLRDGLTESLLVEAAQYADEYTLEILSEADLPCVNPTAVKDADGQTLQEVFDSAHADCTINNVFTQWEGLLRSLDDPWHDAAEQIPAI